MAEIIQTPIKQCAYCNEDKPLGDFLRRTGRRSGPDSRRGACRSCRKERASSQAAPAAVVEPPVVQAGAADESRPEAAAAGVQKKSRRKRGGRRRRAKAAAAVAAAAEQAAKETGGREAAKASAAAPKAGAQPPGMDSAVAAVAQEAGAASRPGAVRKPEKKALRAKTAARSPKQRPLPKPSNHSPTDPTYLRPSGQGTVWMRGKTDKGRQWYQEIELELAVILVNEHAAVVVNRRTIRRLFSNKDFRKYILTRDNYTCFFCKQYGDTIDHMLPRAKGGHTTPDNCVCACHVCNQSKADKNLEDFMREV
ncbi:HNH endonuclease [Paenibacillus algorifonticola]|uniref:HNH endonuclease n=1 Tax=Paenibacillus algorifonticola TaxID=684063 RepID=A0A1I2B8H6_9BACL|nr:HNH endonuclease [Paenibacillus algorifonticola]SFE52512.1 HNH endonuclease [Paenibacillus algorifonticola]